MRLQERFEQSLKRYGIDWITPPMYYNFPNALRFELGLESIENEEEYLRECVSRAEIIYSNLFLPEDEVLICFDLTLEADLKEKLSTVQMQRVKVKYQDLESESTDTKSLYYRYLYKMKSKSCPVGAVFQKIAGGEFGKNKCYSNGVYLINFRNDVILHMYDDRGMDVVAPDKEILRPVYKKLNGLLLDWDRDRMDMLFGDIYKTK